MDLLRILASTTLMAACGAGASLSPLARAVGTYCITCHNARLAEDSVILYPANAEKPWTDAATWERALRELRARAMPPAGNPRPDAKTYAEIVNELAAALDRGDPSKPRAVLQRPTDAEVARRAAKMTANIVTGFFDPWLGLDKLAVMPADSRAFPQFDAALRADLRKETELFVESQLREDRPVLELWTADYTFINDRLAKLYGINGVSGSEFRRVSLEGTERAGLLGQGSFLITTSVLTKHAAVGEPSTSPATRARWIREHFFGIPLRNPMPNPTPMLQGVLLSEQLRTLPDPSCNACHANFLPLGYALENFDPLGRWRAEFGGEPIEVSGAMPDGTSFDGPAGLRRALLERRDAFLTTLVERLMNYAIDGQAGISEPTLPERLPAVRAALREAAGHGYTWSAMLAAVAANLKE